MRQLTVRGLTLIEVMVVVAIMALLAVVGAPHMVDYAANSRVRETASQFHAASMFARSEAIKRNATVRVAVAAGMLQVSLVGGETTTVLRSQPVSDGVTVEAFQVDFDSAGRLTPFGTELRQTVTPANQSCSEAIRCPELRFEAGGTVSLCSAGACS